MTQKELKYHRLYLDIATRISEMSYANRLKVGCVIVKNDNVLSMGFNGMPSGLCNDCETNNLTNPEVIHAEMNALMKLAKSTNSSEGATLYITHSPCINCSKHIGQSGISKIIYKHRYNGTTGCGLPLLEKLNIEVIELK